MLKRVLWIAAGLLLLLSDRGLPAQNAPAPAQLDRGTVTGQIRSTNVASVAGVRIAAMVIPQPGAVSTDAATLERLTTTDSQGRFRLDDMRPGRYYITAGLVDFPTFFPGVPAIANARPVVVSAGSAVTGIDFELAQSPGVKVTGRIKGVPDNLPAGFIRVTLAPRAPAQPGGQLTEALVSSDGTFEIQRVPAGTYLVRTNPSLVFPAPNIPIDVKDSDVGPIELQAGSIIVGHVTVEDGSRLPLPMAMTSGIFNTSGNGGNTNIPSLVQLVANRITSPPSSLPFGSVRADGAFVVVNVQPGEYRIAARLPFGYSIKSMTYGDIDLLRTTLKFDDASHANGSVRVVLTTTQGVIAGVKVSGRVTGAPPPATSWITMQVPSTGLVSEGGVGDAVIRPDGTFEFQRVPPGVYSARVTPLQGFGPQIAVIVADVDVANVEVPSAPPRTASNGATPPALGTSQFPGMPAPLLNQPPSYPSGVTVSGRVSMEGSATTDTPRTVVLFGPRDGLSFQGPIRSDGIFEVQNVPAGTYDARTLPLMVPSVSTRVVVTDKEVNDIRLNVPGARTNP